MGALSFKAQFAEAVQSGRKRQTIRAKRKRPWRVGERLYLYTGMRTKACRKLGETMLTSVRSVRIDATDIFVGGTPLWPSDREFMARLDGFSSFAEMRGWFDRIHGLPFVGDLLAWETVER